MHSRRRRVATAWLLVWALATGVGQACAQEEASCLLVCWNVENLFDPDSDAVNPDADFRPEAPRHWTWSRLQAKCTAIGKALVATGDEAEGATTDGPLLVGLCEVENDRVLRLLCRTAPLARRNYRFLHHDSHDPRGSNVALLYRPDRFRPLWHRPVDVCDSASHFFTRHLLQVVGVVDSRDTLALLVVHLPSRLGGATADRHRRRICHALDSLMRDMAAQYPGATVLAMGDFNAGCDDPCLLRDLHLADRDAPYLDLMRQLPHTTGSYKFHGHWDYIDHFILRRPPDDGRQRLTPVAAPITFRLPQLLTRDKSFGGQRPRRTYHGPAYQRGVSDHLPIGLVLTRQP
ncbi:MAG: endonuclease [Bacteroidales bacterium]|nr:endonuclease [Bacteroidales bacterium]